MIGLKGILITILILSLFGGYLANFFNNVAFYISCGLCQEGKDKLIYSIGSLVSLGQQHVSDGVLGLVELKDGGCIPEYTDGCEFNKIQVSGLATTFKYNILRGTAISIIYIIIFFLAINKGSRWTTGFPVPLIWSVATAFLVVGLVQWGFSGFQELPYKGFVLLVQNIWILSEFSNLASFI